MRKITLFVTALMLCHLGILGAASPSHNAVVLLLDKSGSMKKTDPNCIRWDAVDLMLHLLKNEDKISIISFGTGTSQITNGTVSLNDEIRENVHQAPERCLAKDAFTDILSALQSAEGAISKLGDAHRKAYPPSIVILTDGVDDVKDPASSRNQQIEEVLNSIAKLGGRVHGVGLSSGADRELLTRFRDLTGGETVLISDPKDLLGSFFKLSRELGDRWLLWEGETEGKELVVDLPSWVEEITAVFIPKKSGKQEVFKVNATAADLVTSRYQVVKISGSGINQITLDTGNRSGTLIVDASGDLVLHAKIPQEVPSGIPFQVDLEVFAGRDQELGSAQFLNEMASSIIWIDGLNHQEEVFLYDDGTHEDRGTKDGVFGGRSLIRAPGTAEFFASVKAPFSRALTASGPIQVLGEPLKVQGPVGLSSIKGAFGKSIAWTVANLTEVELPIKFRILVDGQMVDTREFVIKPSSEISIERSFDPSAFSVKKVETEVFAGDQDKPAALSETTIWPIGWLIAIIALTLLIVVGGFFFPRKNLAGTSLNVRYFEGDDEDPIGQTIQFSKSDSSIHLDIPEPFGEPGAIVPRHGYWRRGVLFIPAAGLVPKFSGRRPARSGGGFVIKRTANWSLVSDSGRATYSVTVKR